MKIAIIGSGIAGLMAASILHERGHQITLYESAPTIGGHVHTTWIPCPENMLGEIRNIPHELGVFMLDPKAIHPHLALHAKKLRMTVAEFDLNFTFESLAAGCNWTTAVNSRYQPMRNFLTLLSIARSAAGVKGFLKTTRLLFNLDQLMQQGKEIAENIKYREMSLAEFAKAYPLPQELLDDWLLPQLLCWWGVGRAEAHACSIQVIFDSFYRVHANPQYYLPEGWSTLLERIAAPFKDSILTNRAVDKIIQTEEGVDLVSHDELRAYAHVIIATPPAVALKILDKPSNEEMRVLGAFSTTITEVFLHRDPAWVPQRNPKGICNLITDEKGEYCTFWSGGLHPEKPAVYITWGEMRGKPKAEHIITTKKWLRTLPTVAYTKACHAIHGLQGKGNIWHCGAHVHVLGKGVPSLWHENAFLSGKIVAEMLLKRETNG